MSSLHEIVGRCSHIVAQIVKAELVVCTECDVGLVSLSAAFRVWLMLVDTVNRKSMEHIKRPHPFRVTLSEVIIHSHHMHSITCKSVEEHGQGSHEGLSFTCSHLSNFSLMKHASTEELHVVVYHFPFQVVASCSPMVMVYSLFSVDGDEVVGWICGEVAVEVVGRHNGFLVVGESACRFLHYCIHLRQGFIEFFLIDVKNFLLEFVYLLKEFCTLIDGCVLDGLFDSFNLIFLFLSRRLYCVLYLLGFCTQGVVVEFFYLRRSSLNFFNERLNKLHVPR